MQQLNVSGVSLRIEWDLFLIGTSIFVPTLEQDKTLKQLQKFCAKAGMRTKGKRVIYNGMMGVRLWRIG